MSWRAVRFKASGNKPLDLKVKGDKIGTLSRGEIVVGDVKLKLYHNSDDGEFAVKWFDGKVYNEDKTYYTNDRDDAMATMSDMAVRLLAGK